jgi:hypothetical protein
VEEWRLFLEEKAQVMDMVKVGIYTPRSARWRIEEIDEHEKILTPNHAEIQVQSPSGSQGRFQTLSPTPDHHSPSWDIENLDHPLNNTEDDI